MKIGVLTSSRADYGIYKPLLYDLKNDIFFQLEIISFGTHLSSEYGYTVSDIISDDYKVIHKVCKVGNDDSQRGVVQSYGTTLLKFSEFWNNNKYDIVLCLGDRFEMSAAVQASIPFNVNLAHIHGGETTLGAIDNIYRHQISLASKYHFVSTELNKNKVIELTGTKKNIHNIGSLSLSQIENFKPVNKNILFTNFKIEDAPFILVTFHPETIAIEKNNKFSIEMRKALEYLSNSINIVITMPNADTHGSVYRDQLLILNARQPSKICLVENFGKENYFSAIHYSEFLIGNTSSGIIEAASFGKYVLNVGDRQKGRSQSKNTFDAVFTKNDIIKNAFRIFNLGTYNEENIYYKKDSSKHIINILKK
jgi:GDP/UDP-N,N'-diacetylbacillosamine 2-epimerase (hydrolysing)